MKHKISQEEIESFLNGADDERYIVGIEYDYRTNSIYKIIQDPIKGKLVLKDSFVPFLWVGDLSELNFYKKDKSLQKKKMDEHGIIIEKLNTHGNERLAKGKTFIVKSMKGYTNLLNFFKQGGIDPWAEKYKKHFICLSVVEQYLIQKKKRLFKGFDDYSQIHRLVFDIETTGLDPNTNKIILIGMKDNRGLKKTISALGEDGEKLCIIEFFETLREINPTIIGGYNSAEFDFPFIIKRADILGLDVDKMSKKYFDKGLKRKDGVLKLASETETYNHFMLWGFNIIDISHGVRRAQAINSDIKSWGLKYINKYLEKEKPNRVYVDGAFISKTYLENESYYINPKTGNYKKIGDPGTEGLLEKYPGKFEIWPGRKIVEQYLDDDCYETMVADDAFSQSTFLLSKLVPATYERVATMGTATLWKLIMLAWSYENRLAIPAKNEKRKFTGGLSRLLNAGYAKNIVKFDFSSLYPSIQLVYDVFPECDVTGVQRALLKYFRDVRIFYKREAEKYEKTNPALSEAYKRKQLPIKIFINAYFGSLSAPLVFDWGDMDKGEMITCVGRQSLRMMIMYFQKKGYKPLVMDSVEFDTPVYLRDMMGNIEILPISDLFDDASTYKTIDGLRDFSEKEYEVLTKNGWQNINYVYKHETTKDIYKLVTKDRLVNCTSDHSVFHNGEQIKPINLKRGDKIDIVDIPKEKNENTVSPEIAKLIGFFIGDGSSYYKKVKRPYNSKRLGLKVYETLKGEFTLNNSSLEILEEMKKIIKKEYNIDATIKDYRHHSGVYKLKSSKTLLSKWFSQNCYTSYREKRIPKEILNGNQEILKSFMEGFYLADGWGNDFNEATDITQKSKVCLAGITFILKNLNIDYKISIRADKPNITSLIIGLHRKNKYYKINSFKSNRKNNEIWFNKNMGVKNQFVYDISTSDGTFVGGIGGILLKNTDGVNFEAPENVDKRVYIGKGLNELVEKGKIYHGVKADLAEFNDTFMRNEMGLDIDYFAPSCVNVSRKNYIIKKENGKIKLTGNSIKSKKIQKYVEEFLDKGLPFLLNGDGLSFIELYYEYVTKLYNKEIPLSKIANKARVKQTLDDYKKYIKKTTKSGNLMARQAHMELIWQENYPATLGETIYYVNNGTKKGDGDVKKVTGYDRKYTKKELNAYFNENGKLPEKTSHIDINCYMISESDITNNPDKLGDYNVARYIDTFNKKVLPLLVVFNPQIRDEILVDNPQKRAYFTQSQCTLVNGFPLKEKGQDNFDEVMTLSNTEVEFWNRVNRDPYYMYIDDTVNLVDQYWVNLNRSLLDNGDSPVQNNEDEELNLTGDEYAFEMELPS